MKHLIFDIMTNINGCKNNNNDKITLGFLYITKYEFKVWHEWIVYFVRKIH